MGKNYVLILKLQGLVQGLRRILTTLGYIRVCKKVETFAQYNNLRRGYKISYVSNYNASR